MSQNGKGSAPRNCFSKHFKNNYETINWSKKNPAKESEQEAGNRQSCLPKTAKGTTSYLSNMSRLCQEAID